MYALQPHITYTHPIPFSAHQIPMSLNQAECPYFSLKALET